jgi:hypothetical protein
MRYDMTLLRRFLAKLVHDVLPAALASLIGGFLFTHFQLGRMPEPAVASIGPASVEMMGLLRDEHALMVNFLKAQTAKEQKQIAAAESVRRDTGPPQPATPVAALRRTTAAMVALRPAARGKPPAVGAAPALVIAQAQQSEGFKGATRNEDTLLDKTIDKTIDLKDHVVEVTHHVVSAIGGIPAWIGSIGGRFGGEDSIPRPPADLVSAS